jgi:hypothetical protein
MRGYIFVLTSDIHRHLPFVSLDQFKPNLDVLLKCFVVWEHKFNANISLYLVITNTIYWMCVGWESWKIFQPRNQYFFFSKHPLQTWYIYFYNKPNIYVLFLLNENDFCSCLPQFFYVLSQNRYIWQILIHLTTMINFFITIFILTTFFRYSWMCKGK